MTPFARPTPQPTFHDALASLGVAAGLDWQYTYDDLDRLTRARAGTLSSGSITSETRDQNWTLDHAGNWGNTTFDLNADDVYTGGGEYDWDFTQNKANEITGWDNQSNNVAPTYDAAGNMTDAKRDYKYEYDAWYRLVRVRAQNGSGGDIVAEFKYNGLGHRISARYHETAPWYHFAYDERWRMVAMYEDDAATDVPTEQFWHHNAGPSGFGGSSYIDDVVLRDRMTGAGGEGILDERVYYLQNWHHDVVALVDTSGGIIERANYDGYGMPIGTFSTNGNRRGYAGYEIDPELAGHWHVRHRVLRSDLGVWTRRDPIVARQGLAEYALANLNPITTVDPSGLSSQGLDDLLTPAWYRDRSYFKPRTDAECCADAIQRPPRPITKPGGGVFDGFVICCDNRKVACVGWSAYPGGTRDPNLPCDTPGGFWGCLLADSFYSHCILVHERHHFGHTPECVWAPYPSIYPPPYTDQDPWAIARDECDAHCRQLDCLRLSIGGCLILPRAIDRAACVAMVTMMISVVQYRMRRYQGCTAESCNRIRRGWPFDVVPQFLPPPPIDTPGRLPPPHVSRSQV